MPIPSVERDSASADDSSAKPAPLATAYSPNRTLAWQTDANFTVGDLQASSSPPVKFASSHDSVWPRSKNNKLEEIRQLEIEAALRFPDQPQSSHGAESEDTEAEAERAHQNRLIGRTNTKLMRSGLAR